MCKHLLIQSYTPDDVNLLARFVTTAHDKDGFGAIIRTKSDDILTMKSLHVAEFYIRLMALLGRLDVQTLVVHHRTSTNKSGIEYAHPFELDGHYLTHNGVVDVPYKYPTKTSNDSEELLHHLLACKWQTDEVSGYFSVFCLTRDRTRVLVDDTAPMYTDGRCFSSSKLDESWYAVELQHLVFDTRGEMIDQSYITKKQSAFGDNLRYLSIPDRFLDSGGWKYDDELSQSDLVRVSDIEWDYRQDGVEQFLDKVPIQEQLQAIDIHGGVNPARKVQRKKLHKLARRYGIHLNAEETDYLIEFLVG